MINSEGNCNSIKAKYISCLKLSEAKLIKTAIWALDWDRKDSLSLEAVMWRWHSSPVIQSFRRAVP